MENLVVDWYASAYCVEITELLNNNASIYPIDACIDYMNLHRITDFDKIDRNILIKAHVELNVNTTMSSDAINKHFIERVQYLITHILQYLKNNNILDSIVIVLYTEFLRWDVKLIGEAHKLN